MEGSTQRSLDCQILSDCQSLALSFPRLISISIIAVNEMDLVEKPYPKNPWLTLPAARCMCAVDYKRMIRGYTPY